MMPPEKVMAKQPQDLAQPPEPRFKLVGSREAQELPKIRVNWVRGKDHFDYDRAKIYLILGKKGSGKSVLVENICLRHKKIIDLFGSRDNENLCWLRKTSPIDDILLVVGDNMDVSASWPVCKISDLTIGKMMQYEAVVTCNDFFSSQDSRFASLNMITDLFWERREWTFPVAVAIREASSFLYSRIKQEGLNIKDAKNDFVVWQREMRHFGYSLPIDTIRWTSIDKEVRDLADYLIIKKVGAQGLPYDLKFLYKYVDPMSLARMKPDRFIALSDNASIGLGRTDMNVFHKEEGVDLIKELGIEIVKGEEQEESTQQVIGDREHAELVKLYHQGTSEANVAKVVHRSSSTVHTHVVKHNTAIKKKGLCERCSRAGSDLYNIITRENADSL